jgi:hypothetical protein
MSESRRYRLIVRINTRTPMTAYIDVTVKIRATRRPSRSSTFGEPLHAEERNPPMFATNSQIVGYLQRKRNGSATWKT